MGLRPYLLRNAEPSSSARSPTSSMSGSIPAPAISRCLTPENGLPWPADMYLEGGDQYRGWFHSSLLIGVGPQRASTLTKNAQPTVGRSMRKGAPCPNQSATLSSRKKSSAKKAPISSASGLHRSISPKTCACRKSFSSAFRKPYRKLRNTFRWMLGNLGLLRSGGRWSCLLRRWLGIDAWILGRADDACRALPRLVRPICVSQGLSRRLRLSQPLSLSAVYFDVAKDRLYTAGPHSQARRSAQTALCFA